MPQPRIALLHYSCPPVIGGVEFIIEAHARLFADAGHPTRMVVGKGGRVHSRVRTIEIPELASDGGPHRPIVKGLARGRVPQGFDAAVRQTERALAKALRGVDVCMMHNVLTMHFNLVLTAALANLMARRGDRIHFVGWTHDLTFAEPVYAAHQHDRYPWSLMRTPLDGCRYCAISKERQKDTGRLLGLSAGQVPVIPDGIDVAGKLGLTPMAATIYRDERLARTDIVALTPARVLRRKNLELGMEVMGALKRKGKTVRWLITGAPDPHNPDVVQYFRMLNGLRRKLRLQKDVIFLGQRFDRPVSDDDLRGFFNLSDVLLFPSKREGFGLPILEGGLMRLLLVVNDIPVFRELCGGDAVMLRRGMDMDRAAGRILQRLQKRPAMQYRKRVMTEYGWEELFTQRILPAALTPGKVWRAG